MCIYTASYSKRDLRPFEIHKTVFLHIAHSTQACAFLLRIAYGMNEWVWEACFPGGGRRGEGVIVSDPGEQPVLPSCAQGIVPLKLSSVSGHLFVPVWFSLLSGGEHVCRPGHKEWPPLDQIRLIPSCYVCYRSITKGAACMRRMQQLGLSAPPSLPTWGIYS